MIERAKGVEDRATKYLRTRTKTTVPWQSVKMLKRTPNIAKHESRNISQNESTNAETNDDRPTTNF